MPFTSRLIVLAPLVAAAALAATARPLATMPAAEPQGLDFAGMDTTVAPGYDFFRYANGSWLNSTEIPADESSWGPGEALTELTTERIAGLIHEAAASSEAGSEGRKIGDYYAAFMDEAGIEHRALQPLAADLERITAISNRAQLARVLGGTLRADVDILNYTQTHTENLFGLWVAQDFDDPAHYSPFLVQGGLGMPDRDYYLDPAAKMARIRALYLKHIASVLTLAGVPDAHSQAVRIFALERSIARAHSSRAQTEEVLKGNNHWLRTDFAQRAPGLDWTAFFVAASLGEQREFVVWQPRAAIGTSALAARVPLATWKEYLRFHLIESNCPYLPAAFVAEHFAFHERTLSGTPQLKPRWKRAVDETNDALGDAVGKLYVARYFPPEAKARAEGMVRNLLAAFAQRIERLAWMTPETRAKAQAKLATLRVGVGYSDHWRDYSVLEVVRGDAYGNAARARRFEYRRNLAKLAGPVDRSEWVMNAQLVNAVNLPAMNALNFPAATLQPPYFDPARDPVMDYGAIGATIGHEISHSFDDQGALFDADGRLRNWWTPEDFAHFKAAGERLVEEFNAYHPFPDVSVHGRQTLSENIADVAGLSVAYDAWRASLAGRSAPTAGGFSGEQLFFLSFAQGWREKIRDEALRQEIITDGHAPDEYRADTVRNLDAWYEAFEVKPDAKLYLAPADRVPVW